MPNSAKRHTGRKTLAKVVKTESRELARGNSSERGYNARWQRARRVYLAAHPFCSECERNGHTREATTVDHKRPHRGNMELFWDWDNWQALCKACHDRKTGKGQ